MKGYVPIKLITLIVGVVLALVAFDFVYNQILSSCKFVGCDYLAITAGILVFVAVLAFFNEELRVLIRGIIRV